MKRLTQHFFLILGLSSAISCLADDTNEISRLEKKLVYAEWLKARIEQGVSPCHQDDCQQTKAQILNSAFQKASRLPPFLTKNQKDFFSQAYRILDDPWIRPESFFPETLRDWKQWWDHRFRDDAYRSILWMQYINELNRHYASLDAFIDRQKASSPNQKKLLDDAFQKGAGRICVLLKEVPRMMDEVGYLEATNQMAEAEVLREKAYQLTKEREDLEYAFGGQFEGVMIKLFPRMSFKTITSTVSDVVEWMSHFHYTSTQHPHLIDKLKYYKESIRQVQEQLQKFNDLEFGLVGLRNFHTTVNPLIASQQEAIIQEYLDLVDMAGRGAAGIATLFVAQSLMAGFTQSIFWRLAVPGIASSVAIQYDFEVENIIWSRSTITRDLTYKIKDLERGAGQKFNELLNGYQTVSLRIETLKFQIESLKNNPTMILEGGNS